MATNLDNGSMAYFEPSAMLPRFKEFRTTFRSPRVCRTKEMGVSHKRVINKREVTTRRAIEARRAGRRYR